MNILTSSRIVAEEILAEFADRNVNNSILMNSLLVRLLFVASVHTKNNWSTDFNNNNNEEEEEDDDDDDDDDIMTNLTWKIQLKSSFFFKEKTLKSHHSTIWFENIKVVEALYIFVEGEVFNLPISSPFFFSFCQHIFKSSSKSNTLFSPLFFSPPFNPNLDVLRKNKSFDSCVKKTHLPLNSWKDVTFLLSRFLRWI